MGKGQVWFCYITFTVSQKWGSQDSNSECGTIGCNQDFHHWHDGDDAGTVCYIEQPKIFWARHSNPGFLHMREIWDSGAILVQYACTIKVRLDPCILAGVSYHQIKHCCPCVLFGSVTYMTLWGKWIMSSRAASCKLQRHNKSLSVLRFQSRLRYFLCRVCGISLSMVEPNIWIVLKCRIYRFILTSLLRSV